MQPGKTEVLLKAGDHQVAGGSATGSAVNNGSALSSQKRDPNRLFGHAAMITKGETAKGLRAMGAAGQTAAMSPRSLSPP